jgi:hypothetical protein
MKWLEQALLIVSAVWHEEVVWEELKLKLRWPYDLTELCVSHLWKVCSLKFWWNRIIDVGAQYVQPVLQLMTFCWSTFEWKWFAEWTSLKWKSHSVSGGLASNKRQKLKSTFHFLEHASASRTHHCEWEQQIQTDHWDTFRISSLGHGVFHNNQGR